jgi:bud emergence protein 1
LYGIVLYDFQAERSDELDAKAGEPIIIIAQSNAEWYVAKPIGRLGGPGLIPVAFVDIRDASTGRTVNNYTPQSSFPNVEDWKKQTLGYEASSIPLNHIEQHMRQMSIEEEEEDPVHEYYQPDNLLDNYGMMHLANTSSSSMLDKDKAIVVSAYIDSHILEGDQYWFIVFAKLNNGKHRVLYRLYEGTKETVNGSTKADHLIDFYDFQINFLQEFPAEAGKQDQTRILPFMPGPLDTVDDNITGKSQFS